MASGAAARSTNPAGSTPARREGQIRVYYVLRHVGVSHVIRLLILEPHWGQICPIGVAAARAAVLRGQGFGRGHKEVMWGRKVEMVVVLLLLLGLPRQLALG